MGVSGYFDTCIVSGFAKDDLKRSEVTALERTLELYQQGKIKLVVSVVVQREIAQIPEVHRSKHETILKGFSEVPAARTFETMTRLSLMGTPGARSVPDRLFSLLRSILPDSADAEHVFQAAKNEVQYLITVDHKTFIPYAAAVLKVCPVRVISPEDFITVCADVGLIGVSSNT